MVQAYILQLAQELIDDILDHVFANEGLRRMKACALTCKAFRLRSQMHIFSTIKLRSDICKEGQRGERIKGLLNILHSSPDLAKHIYAIHLGIWSFDSAWIAECPPFRELMALLNKFGCRPKELEVEGLDPFVSQSFPDTPHHPTSFEDNIFLPFLAPSIVCLRLFMVNNIPPTVISSCVNLKRLRLVCTELKTRDNTCTLEPYTMTPYPKIDTLEFDRPTGTMMTILDTFEDRSVLVNLTELRVLHSTINVKNAPYVTKIIKASANYLEEVQFCCSSEYGSLYYLEEDEVIPPFDFSRVPRLRVLAINTAVETTPSLRTAHKILTHIYTILTTIPTTNMIERLNYCAFLDMAEFKTFFGDDPTWGLLDSEIARIASSGRRLAVGYSLHVLSSLSYEQGDPGEAAMLELKDLVKRCFPQCTSLPNVCLEVYTYLEHAL
ncbi:hypothetical protein CVT26_014849 [Gymnopilus dilepis]|uniref:F-box domain-containing protein n=1 Tax=Gymnopilus dilepis TaxID=231916 RepID=A0A409XX19_9AGAR|nr:hypothetical protein CVT26_014849 [Gymnopilus dilepis]